MKLLYAETSAVLRWLLGAARGQEVRTLLAEADHVFASRLTTIEARRVLLRATTVGELTETTAITAQSMLATAVARWTIVEIGPEIAERASARFPQEPVRTLDALHLATALFVTAELGPVAILSLDQRIRLNASLPGLPLAME